MSLVYSRLLGDGKEWSTSVLSRVSFLTVFQPLKADSNTDSLLWKTVKKKIQSSLRISADETIKSKILS